MKTDKWLAKALIFIVVITATGDMYAQDSRNGYWLPPGDTLRIFLVYAELANDPDEPGTVNGWEPGGLPPHTDFFFDYRMLPGQEPGGMLTRYFYQASFGQYIVLADHYPEVISVDFGEVQGNGFHQVLAAMQADGGDDILTAHGYSVNRGDFDQMSSATSYGLPKIHRPDSMIDMLMVIWRVNSKMSRSSSGGYCVPAQLRRNIKAMKGMNSYSNLLNKGATNYPLIRHEFSHLLLGPNNFHTGGSGAGTKTFMSSAGGYAMLSSWDRYSQVYCGFDRRRLGWKHPGHHYQISARDPLTGDEVPSDLVYGQPFEHGSNLFLLRDFVSTGDEVRIELPYLYKGSAGVNRQWLWLENHQMMPENIDHTGHFRKGINAYIQVNKETLSGPGTFGGNGNYTWPLSAFGNFDYLVDEESETESISDSLRNPFTGYNNLIYGAYDLGERDGLIYRNELFLAKNLKVNGEFLDSSVYRTAAYPLFGTVMDAFRPGDRIAIDENPAAVPVLTYYTPASASTRPGPPRSYDNRSIPLNGIAIEIMEEREDGSIVIRIRWDERKVRKQVRWCGDIHLYEDLYIARRAGIRIDLGLTPQKPKDPMDFNGMKVFADSSRFTLEAGSRLVMKRRSTLVIDPLSTLLLMPGSRLEMGPRSRLIIRNTGSLRALEGSSISGRGRIIPEEGAVIRTENK